MLAVVGISPAEGWRGIVPLHSTRMDVERLLGSPRESRGVASNYETESERVLVFYSADPCKKGEEWNVPRGTVASFTVSPKATLPVADLKLEETNYKRVLDSHVQGIVYYFNKEQGIRIETRLLGGGREDVNSITYEPAAKDNYLRCAGAPAVSDVDVTTPPPTKFDEYSNIAFSDEKARLGNLAIYLQQDPKMIGYIIAYAGRRARAGEAKARTERAKSYLVKERGIEAERIVTIDGGYREEPMVELYILPRGISAPTPYPTLEPSEAQIIRDSSAKTSNRRSSQSRCK
jgi:hypothetical protein